ncbi:MAG: CvpA family protein [Deltaproteobacteria bacterium]|nr:CvpA family protein [Deltaproteobacteria bacterium]
MNPFDIFIIIVLSYSIIRGLFRGLVKEVSSVIGVLGGFYAAYSYYPMAAKLLSGIVKDQSYLNILSFLIIFCGILIVISILGVVIKYLLNVAFLGWIDRICGVGFGLIKGVLIVTVMFIILTTFLSKGTPLIKQSILAPHVIWISEKMVGLASDDLKKDFFTKLDEFKKAWKIQK